MDEKRIQPVKTWEFPDYETLNDGTDYGDRMTIARQYRNTRKKQRQGSISKLKNTELAKNQKEYYTQYVNNFLYYIGIIGRKAYTTECEVWDVQPMYRSAENFFNNPEQSIIHFNHITQVSAISRIPIGVWMLADMKYLNENMIIKITPEKAEIEISAAYFTDGVYFYGKYLTQFAPLGSIKIQKAIDEQLSPINYKL
jgi:hypothetical protein